MELRALKDANNCLNTDIYSYLEASIGIFQRSFFQHQCQLDICGSLRQLFSCMGV
jgi:hypothetical protein